MRIIRVARFSRDAYQVAMTHPVLTQRVWFEMAVLALLWGGSFLAVRTALDHVPVVTSVAHRVFWAALVLWVVVYLRGETVPFQWKTWAIFFVMGLLNNVIPFTLMAWGQLQIETGLTAILNAATAIWGVLVAAIVFADEKLTVRRLFGVLLGFGGVATAIGFGEFTALDPRAAAQVAVLVATLSYAVAGSWARKTMSQVSPIVAAAGMLTGAAAVLVPGALWVDGSLATGFLPDTLFAIAYYSIAATALAYLLYYRILAAAGAGNLLLVTLLIPPVAILLGSVVRNEHLGIQAYLGFGILGTGLLILNGRLRLPLEKKKSP